MGKIPQHKIEYWMSKGYSEEESNKMIEKSKKENSIYCKEYWIKRGFSEDESIRISEKTKRENSQWCKEYWIKRGFSEDESLLKIKEIQKRNSLKRDRESYDNMLNPYQVEYWMSKGLTDKNEIELKIKEHKIKTNSYLSLSDEKYELMMNNRSKTYYSKTDEERKNINLSRGRTNEQLIKKFGKEYVDKIHEHLKNRNYFRRFSKISEKFFNELQDKVSEKLIFGKDEKWIRYDKNKGYFIDLLVEGTNKIIEFNGDFYHANPELYESNDIITISKEKILLVKDIWESDKLKISALNNLGYDVLIIWENDINNNKEVELNKCINFIKNNKI